MPESTGDRLSVLWLNQLDPGHPWAGGAERHIAEVGRRLVAQGHSLTIVSEAFEGLPAEETRGGIRTLRPVRRGLLHAWVLSNAARLVRDLRIDVVLGDLSKIVPWGRHSIGGAPLVSVVRHFSGHTIFAEVPFPAPPALWAVERLTPIFLRGSAIVTESHATATTLARLGAGNARITLIPPGVDSSRFSPDPEQRSPTPLIIYIGRLKRYKRLDLAVRAFASIRVCHPDAVFLIGGSGSDYERLHRTVARLGLEGSVQFLGTLPVDEVVRLYRRAWVHVQPSGAEGWGLTALESMACGTPVVAFNSGSLPESVGPRCADLLAEDANVGALAAALTRGLARPEVHDPTEAMALAQYARQFSWDATADRYGQLLAEAVRSWVRPLPETISLPVPSRWSRTSSSSVRSPSEGVERVTEHVEPA
ncbi:MAG: glycosyltransferase family 4 protein [Thermoplasmata archaeon]|nr:glycosyltransferase family 4 protein [Thermoplasmata archaeon]